jgi:hypothetical protein
MTTPSKNTSYPYNIDKITYLNLDDAYSSSLTSLLQRTQDQYKPNRLDMGIMNEDCGSLIDRDRGLSPTQRAEKYYNCCVGHVGLWLYRQPGMKNLSKCQIFQSCVRDCRATPTGIPDGSNRLPCEIECMGYLPVIPGKGTTETADYCDGLIREYERKYKQQYDQGIKTCKEMSKSVGFETN